MSTLITGIHHITALASDPQKNLDFYTSLLGLRLVKKTINFDAPDVYHFYFGDKIGTPGTILTFFPFPGARKGQKGVGETTYTAFSIPPDSLSYWQKRIKEHGLIVSDEQERFGEKLFRFEDHDGMGIELIASSNDPRPGWQGGKVPADHAIKGFHSATLNLRAMELTTDLLTEAMDYQFIGEENNRFRFGVAGQPGDLIDIVLNQPASRSVQSAGTVHHIAFRTATRASQLEIQHKLQNYGQQVTEVKDRNYFYSIYFREPGGILFEVATDEPGFAIDETVEELGNGLKLPTWAEPHRDRIEKSLPKLQMR
ncbi:Glyoxalase family protein [Lunatimonas lonarensis]|uniref:Glyoxalase family protein n=1 Tax=Lunatimonas lonarensis TaxID=1232681 RepID=R7ZXT0_9BACT|nr:ring-cleaving dioxygenase [Lunatimonas lonarensis]EON78799.1 Glyoxalase family protein [Lunatimonas lonarensis]